LRSIATSCNHGFSESRSRQLALGVYGRAIALGDPEGAAHYSKGLLYRLTGSSAEAAKLFQGAVERNPQHLDALAELGQAALESKDLEKAISHLRAYVELSAKAGTGSYYRQHYASLLMKALYDKANHLIDFVRDPVAAEAAFDEVLSVGPHVPAALRNFEGAWVGKSNARAWRGDHVAALEFAERALELIPKVRVRMVG
jgi:tetratricopeptide (TPR) repeat protein